MFVFFVLGASAGVAQAAGNLQVSGALIIYIYIYIYVYTHTHVMCMYYIYDMT